MGSSAITPIIKGQTGPTGPKGPKGNIGPTGTGVGLTGNTGTTGRHVTNVFPGTFFQTSDNSGISIVGTRGPTGYTGTMFGENLGTGLTLYSAINGFTLSVRGLTFVGNLSAEVTGGTILITPADVYYGDTLATGIQNDRVLYSKTSSIIDSTRIQLGKTHSDFIFSRIQGITPGSLPVYSEMSGNVIDVPAGGNDIILGLTQGSIYRIHTPLGLSGFTLTPSLYGDNEILSFTFFVEGNGFTQFPSNVYFEDSPYDSTFSCGTNIMNLFTYDKGINWFARIIDHGYGTSVCIDPEGIGSCCYAGPSGQECQEYYTKQQCHEKSGTFALFSPCSKQCSTVSTCCSNGNCVENVSRNECLYFGGKYYEGIQCSNVIDADIKPNTERFCYKENLPPTSCCTGGQCIPDVTFNICQSYYNGVPFTGTCCELNCSSIPPRKINGACCISGSQTCENTTPDGCSALDGVFYGDGTTCGGVTCCTPTQTGSCCVRPSNGIGYRSGCFWPRTNIQCSPSSIFRAGISCDAPCPLIDWLSYGLCCKTDACSSDITREQCLQQDANAIFFPNIVFDDRINSPYRWNDEDCTFCNYHRNALIVSARKFSETESRVSVSFRCFGNNPTTSNESELEAGWTPRIAINDNPGSSGQAKIENGTLSNTLYLGVSGSGPEINLEPKSGFILISNIAEEYNNSEKLLQIDSFLAGHIWVRRLKAVTEENWLGTTYEDYNSPSENTTFRDFYIDDFIVGDDYIDLRDAQKNFIYNYYLKDLDWVFGDYQHKIYNHPNSGESDNSNILRIHNAVLEKPNDVDNERILGWRCCRDPITGPGCGGSPANDISLPSGTLQNFRWTNGISGGETSDFGLYFKRLNSIARFNIDGNSPCYEYVPHYGNLYFERRFRTAQDFSCCDCISGFFSGFCPPNNSGSDTNTFLRKSNYCRPIEFQPGEFTGLYVPVADDAKEIQNFFIDPISGAPLKII